MQVGYMYLLYYICINIILHYLRDPVIIVIVIIFACKQNMHWSLYDKEFKHNYNYYDRT